MISAVIITLLLAIIAVITAVRLQQIGTEPVAPSVPKSKPKAQETIPTPGPDSQCQLSLVIPSPTLGPSATPTPTGTLTPTPTSTPTPTGTLTPTPTGALSCSNINIPGGTTRAVNEAIRFTCAGQPETQITQCRFRFGDGSQETFDDDCNIFHAYAKTGTYQVSCELKDTKGFWRSSAGCDGQIDVVAGPTATSTPGSAATSTPKATSTPLAGVPTAVPTVAEQALPQAGGIGQTLGVISAGLGAIILGILLLL